MVPGGGACVLLSFPPVKLPPLMRVPLPFMMTRARTGAFATLPWKAHGSVRFSGLRVVALSVRPSSVASAAAAAAAAL